MKYGDTGLLKRAGALCLAFTFAAAAITGMGVPDEVSAHHRTYRTSSIVMDADSGRVYSESQADARRYPASLTKIMTMIVTFDAIKNGKVNLDTELKVPHQATRVAPSKLGLRAGQHIPVKQAISALIVKSANDVAVTLAHNVGGSERSFVRMMNAKAKEIGLTHTNFANASGLFNSRQYTTARDMAKLARHLINEYPGFYEYFSRQDFEFEGIIHGTHNHLMQQYDGMDGIKTGYIQASGHNLVSSAHRDNKRMIGVIFGGHSAAERDAEMARKLDVAFAQAAENDNNPRYSQGFTMPSPGHKKDRPARVPSVRMPRRG